MRNVEISIEKWPLKAPFYITGHHWTSADVLKITITENGISGQGEASGIYYCDETADSIYELANSVKSQLENGLTREALQSLLPRGGARNAIDCALWDLEAKTSKKSAFELTGITASETLTFATVGIDTPEAMAKAALGLDTPNIKVKLSGELPLERITAVCNARPDATIIVDVNQGWTFEQLVDLAPKFKALGVKMLEQPLPRGADSELEGYDSPILLCADESCLDTSELAQAAKRYKMINIKLDKTGGLTEALKLAKQALDLDLKLMVGNMLGTSLAMSPSYVVAQLCDFVDLDGPMFLKDDRAPALQYNKGIISGVSSELWG